MKRSASQIFWTFVGLFVVNIWIALVLVVATRQWQFHWSETVPGADLPAFTLIAFRAAYFWPALAIAVCLVGAHLALHRQTSDHVLWFLATGLAIVEIALLGLHTLGWVLPAIGLDYRIGDVR